MYQRGADLMPNTTDRSRNMRKENRSLDLATCIEQW